MANERLNKGQIRGVAERLGEKAAALEETGRELTVNFSSDGGAAPYVDRANMLRALQSAATLLVGDLSQIDIKLLTGGMLTIKREDLGLEDKSKKNLDGLAPKELDREGIHI